MSKKSEIINFQKLKNASDELFEELDSDNDGLISAKRINIDTISRKKLKILCPILIQIEKNRATLNKEQFLAIIKEFCYVNFHV